MANLGRAVSILLAYETEIAYRHQDMCGWPDMDRRRARILARRFRLVRKRACKVAGVKNLRLLRRAVKRVCPTWDRYNHFRLGITAI